MQHWSGDARAVNSARHGAPARVATTHRQAECASIGRRAAYCVHRPAQRVTGNGTSNSFCRPRHEIGPTRRTFERIQHHGPSAFGSLATSLTDTKSIKLTIAIIAPGCSRLFSMVQEWPTVARPPLAILDTVRATGDERRPRLSDSEALNLPNARAGATGIDTNAIARLPLALTVVTYLAAAHATAMSAVATNRI
jgi:hypothetical protein